jgi:hypothetical protein
LGATSLSLEAVRLEPRKTSHRQQVPPDSVSTSHIWALSLIIRETLPQYQWESTVTSAELWVRTVRKEGGNASNVLE